MNQLGNYMNSTSGITATVVLILLGLAIFTILFILNVKPYELMYEITVKVGKLLGKNINKFEQRYHRDAEIGKIHDKSKRRWVYKHLNDLTIDLGYKKRGVTPYELMFFVILGSIIGSFIIGSLLFSSMLLSIISFPIVLVTVLCFLITRANLSHDNRIDAVIMAENIISNNIERGVVVAVKSSIDSMPLVLQEEFRDFIDNVEVKNFFIKTALLDLNNSLGSVADEFIQKCITFELEEEVGLSGIFKDVVEVNNMKSEFRIDMKRMFEQVKTEFYIGTLAISIFLCGAIYLYPILQTFYFKTIIGQLILLADALIVILEYVYITYLRAQEL